MNNKTLVFGCSGTVGLEFISINKNKNIIFYSRKKPKKLSNKSWRYIDLNKKINNIPRKVKNINLVIILINILIYTIANS